MSSYDQTVSMLLNAQFSQANTAIESCIAKLKSLSSTIESINKNISGLKAFKSAMQSLSKLNFGNLGNASASIQTLTHATNDLSAHLTKLKDTANSINALKSALNGLGRVNVANTKNAILGISSAVQEASKGLNATDTKKIADLVTKYTDLTKAITEYNRQVERARKNTNSINSARMTNAMRSAKKSIDSTNQSLSVFSKTLSNLWTFGKWYAIFNQLKAFGRGLVDSLNKPIEFAETENYFSVAFGKMRDEAFKFGNDLANAFGLALPNIIKMQATFKNMLGSLGGLTEATTSKISQIITKMTIDYASLYNVSIENASQKFQSALSRQVRPIRSTSGYDITSNVLGGTLQELGIYDRAISKMSEMEKRLLVIITLQKQMDRSGALQDFARTIEQPANQLKIFAEQVSELGRAFGSLFTSSIAKILPYINGLVMALKEAVMNMAFLFGYELPKSNGATGTILDNYDDSLTDINGGLEDIGKTTDKNYEKTKKWKNFLASFDVAEVIPTPTEYSGDSNSVTSGGVGAEYIDPRILTALQDYDNLMYSIDMKANSLKNKVQSIFSTIGEWTNENIFKPITDSWNAYATPILTKISSIKDNIMPIFGDLASSIDSNLSGTVTSFSNFTLSTLNLVLGVVDGISALVKSAWDVGGKPFVDGFNSLVDGILDFATSFNDYFFTPLGQGISLVLTPFAELLGVVVASCGTIIGWFGDLLKYLSKSKAFIVTIGSLLAGFTATSFIGGLLTAPTKLVPLLQRITNILKNTRLFKAFNVLKTGFDVCNSALKSAGLVTKIGELGTKLTLASGSSSTLASALKGTLGSALSWVASHPAVALALAIGGVVTALVALGDNQDEVTYSMEDFSEEVQAQITKVNELDTTIDSLKASYEDAFAEAVAEAETLEDCLSRVEEASADGIIEENEMTSVKASVDLLNESLGETVVEIKNGTVAWKKDKKAIQERIKKLKESAIEEAKIQLYTQYVKDRIAAEIESNRINDQILDKQKEIDSLKKARDNAAINRDNESMAEYSIALAQAKADLAGLEEAQTICNGKVEEMNSNLDKLDETLTQATDDLGTTKNAVKSLSNTVANADTNVDVKATLKKPTETETNTLIANIQSKMKGLTAKIGVETQGIKTTLENFFKNNVFNMRGQIAVRMPGSNLGSSLDDTYITPYATGGFPRVGEMFIARENGAEMVGRIGNKTAVANNQQIVDGIASGVYQAMTSAMSNQGGDLYLTIQNSDGSNTRKIIRDYNNYMKQTGGRGGFNI